MSEHSELEGKGEDQHLGITDEGEGSRSSARGYRGRYSGRGNSKTGSRGVGKIEV